MKAVIDTNIFIDAFFHNDRWCKQVIERGYAGEYSMAMNERMRDELSVAFLLHAQRLGVTISKLQGPIRRLCNLLWHVEKVPTCTKSDLCTEHSADNIFINCAVDCKAGYIVTDNGAHLFGLEKNIKEAYGLKLKIQSAYQFVIELNALKLQSKIKSRR